MDRLARISPFFILAASVLAGAIGTKFVHEFGHAITAIGCGATIRRVCIMPGLQLYPVLGKARCRICSVTYSEPEVPWKRGLVAFMGTGATTLTAYLLLILLWRMHLPTWGRLSLAVIAVLLAWDMFLYSTLPLVGIRRFLLFGGQHAEPVHAMELMGVTKTLFLVGLALSFATFHGLLLWILRAKSA